MNSVRNVCAIVVTYNRLDLLECCVTAISTQTTPPTCTLVIDNASTDGTNAWLGRWESATAGSSMRGVVTLATNLGGAGGFAAGMREAMRRGYDWAWMMDDDAAPHPDALMHLCEIATNTSDVYGSLAVCGTETSWLTTLLGPPEVSTTTASDIPASASVKSLPFLGFFIHRRLIERIGLPDAGFFIAADDIEYCMRARRVGARIVVSGQSRIEHPKSRPYTLKLPWHTLTALALPPWKRYYDTRNRLLIARKYYGFRILTQTIPGSVIRLAAALLREPHRAAQFKAWCCGMFDGLLGIRGRRHDRWGIRQ